MNTLDIVLINIICYLGGILSGFGLCFKYKKDLLLKTSSHSQLSDILNSIHSEIAAQPTAMGAPISSEPVIASAPPSTTLSEVIIRTKE